MMLYCPLFALSNPRLTAMTEVINKIKVGFIGIMVRPLLSIGSVLFRNVFIESSGQTYKLPKHKTPKMTDRYNDDRGKVGLIVSAKTGS